MESLLQPYPGPALFLPLSAAFHSPENHFLNVCLTFVRVFDDTETSENKDNSESDTMLSAAFRLSTSTYASSKVWTFTQAFCCCSDSCFSVLCFSGFYCICHSVSVSFCLLCVCILASVSVSVILSLSLVAV